MQETDAAPVSRASRPAMPRAVTRALPSHALRVSGRSNMPARKARLPERRLRAGFEEREHFRPRIVRGVRELLLLAVEEAVRRALVRHELVLDARVLQRALKGGVVLGGDVLVGARLQREDRRLELAGALGRVGRAPVEADGACEPVLLRGGEPRLAAAEAEPDRENPFRAVLAQIRDTRGDIGLDGRRR